MKKINYNVLTKEIIIILLLSLIIAFIFTVTLIVFEKCPEGAECAPTSFIRLFISLWLIIFIILSIGYFGYKLIKNIFKAKR